VGPAARRKTEPRLLAATCRARTAGGGPDEDDEVADPHAAAPRGTVRGPLDDARAERLDDPGTLMAQDDAGWPDTTTLVVQQHLLPRGQS